jgi:hypothetical protein
MHNDNPAFDVMAGFIPASVSNGKVLQAGINPLQKMNSNRIVS